MAAARELLQIAVETDTDQAQASLDGLLDRFTGPAGLAAAAAAVGAGLVAFAADTLDAADEIDALSTRTGVSAENLQRWGEIARRSGGDMEDVADAAREMQLRLAEAAALGSGPAVDALALLGLAIDDIPLDDANASFELLRDRIADVHDPARRLFVAEELLGGSVERLNGLLAAHRDELAAVKVLTDEQVAAANDAHDAIAQLGHTLSTTGQQLLIEWAPTIERWAVGTEALLTGTAQVTDAQDRLNQLIDTWLPLARQGIITWDEYNARIAAARAEIEQTGTVLLPAERITAAYAGSQRDLALAMRDSVQPTRDMWAAIDGLAGAAADADHSVGALQGRMVTLRSEAAQVVAAFEAMRDISRGLDIGALVAPAGSGLAGIGGLPTQGVADVAPPPLPDGAVL